MTKVVMEHNTRNARMAGVLIILGYVAYGIPQGTHIQPLLNTADPLATVAANTAQLTTGALLMGINAAAVVGISLFLYPTLRRHNEAIALSYVGTRIFESVVLIGGIISLLLLVPLSQEYVQSSATDTTSFEALATLAVQGNFFAYHVAMIGLSLGSLPFCYLLYRARLVPRVIAAVGLIGYPALLILMIVEVFGVGAGPILYALYVPGTIFEIGLALWLLVKGFNQSTISPTDPAANVGEPTKWQ